MDLNEVVCRVDYIQLTRNMVQWQALGEHDN
jgi:hypothetical protein